MIRGDVVLTELRQRLITPNEYEGVALDVAPETPYRGRTAKDKWLYFIAPEKNNAVSKVIHNFLGIKYTSPPRIPFICIDTQQPDSVEQFHSTMEAIGRIAQVSKAGQHRFGFVKALVSKTTPRLELASQQNLQQVSLNILKMFITTFVSTYTLVIAYKIIDRNSSFPIAAEHLCIDICAKSILKENNLNCDRVAIHHGKYVGKAFICNAVAKVILPVIQETCGVSIDSSLSDFCNARLVLLRTLITALIAGLVTSTAFLLISNPRWLSRKLKIEIEDEAAPNGQRTIDARVRTTVYHWKAGSRLFGLTPDDDEAARHSSIYKYRDLDGETQMTNKNP